MKEQNNWFDTNDNPWCKDVLCSEGSNLQPASIYKGLALHDVAQQDSFVSTDHSRTNYMTLGRIPSVLRQCAATRFRCACF
jgi:hypothetical protein